MTESSARETAKAKNWSWILAWLAALLLGLFAGQYLLEMNFKVPYLECRSWACLFRTVCWYLVAGIISVGLGIFFKKKIKDGRQNLSQILVWMVGVALVVICIKIPPVGTQDPYWNLLLAKGWVSAGLNPYQTTAVMMAQDPLYQILDSWKDSSMTHGPLWVGMLGWAIRVSSDFLESILILKILAGGALILTAWLAGRVAGQKSDLDNSNRKTIVIATILWNPFILEQVVVNLHADIYLGLAVLAGLYFSSRNQNMRSAVCLILGALVKYVSGILIVIPIWQAMTRPGSLAQKIRRGLGMIVVSAAIFLATTYTLGFSPIDLASALGEEARNRLRLGFSWFWTGGLLLIFRTPAVLRLAAIITAFFTAIWLETKGVKDYLTYVLPLLVLILLSPWFMSWYALWFLPVLAASEKWQKVWWWSAVLPLTNGLFPPVFLSGVLVCVLPILIVWRGPRGIANELREIFAKRRGTREI